jgi:hypothetical protein
VLVMMLLTIDDLGLIVQRCMIGVNGCSFLAKCMGIGMLGFKD